MNKLEREYLESLRSRLAEVEKERDELYANYVKALQGWDKAISQLTTAQAELLAAKAVVELARENHEDIPPPAQCPLCKAIKAYDATCSSEKKG